MKKPKGEAGAKGTDAPVTKWKDRLIRSKQYQEANNSDWKRNADLLFGANPGSSNDNEMALGWACIQQVESLVYVTHPDMSCEARDFSKQARADMLGEICRYDADQMGLKAIGELTCIDKGIYGYSAVIEALETKKVTKQDPETDEEVDALEYQCYEGRRIDPKDILFDPGGLRLDLSDHAYTCVAFYPTIQQLRDDPNYTLPDDIDEYPECTQFTRANGRKGRGAYSTRGSLTGNRVMDEHDPAFRTICCWEIWDKVNQEVITLTDHRYEEIGVREWPVKLKIGPKSFFPITLDYYFPSTLGFYPKPMLSLIANQLIMYNRLDHRMYVDTVTKWRKFATVADFLNAEQEGKLTDPSIENAVITIDKDMIADLAGTGGSHQLPDMGQLVVPIQDPSPNRDVVQVRDLIKAEIYEILGFGDPARGGMPTVRSAREAVAIKDKQQQRIGKLEDRVAEFYRNFFSKHILFLQQTMEVDRYVRVLGDSDVLATWKKYDKDDIQGDFEYIVYSGTSGPRNTEARRNSELQLFQAIAPILQGSGLPLEPAFVRLGQAMQWKGIDQMFKNYKQAGKQVAGMLASMQKQQVPPQDFLNAVSQLVGAVLTPEELKMVAQAVQGMQTGPGANPPSMQAPGQRGDPGQGSTGSGVM